MFRLELLQNIPLPLLITSQPAHLLLALIIHHLLDHRSRLAIEIAQTRVLRLDFRHVDLRRARYNMCPPFHLVDFVQVDGDFFSWRLGSCLESPG